MKRLYVYSNPTIDVVCVSGKCGGERAGGPAYYAALAARILGFEVWLYGSIGYDGHLVIREYQRVGVRFARLGFSIEEKSTRFKLEYSDGRRVEVLEVGPVTRGCTRHNPRLVSPVIREFPRVEARMLAEGAAIDVQGFVRARRRGPVTLEQGWCEEAAARALIVHADTIEALHCLGADTPQQLADRIVELGNTWVVTGGMKGAVIIHEEGTWRVYPWGPRVEDATGMGDVYTSTITHLYFNEGFSVVDAARVASVVAGLHASREYEERDLNTLLRLAEREVKVVKLDPKEALRLQLG